MARHGKVRHVGAVVVRTGGARPVKEWAVGYGEAVQVRYGVRGVVRKVWLGRK